MFEYLKGIVTAINPTYVVVEVSGVGYRVLVANPYRYQINIVNTIYIEQIVRDNEQVLYGFFDLAEKQLFRQLTSVSGIGPKSALAILADDDHSGLIQAIMQNDVQFLTKFPGVGKKTAQQIVLDLKDKLAKQELSTTAATLNLSEQSTNTALQDGLEALMALGYSNREIEKIKPQLAQTAAQDAGAYLRAGLQLLK